MPLSYPASQPDSGCSRSVQLYIYTLAHGGLAASSVAPPLLDDEFAACRKIEKSALADALKLYGTSRSIYLLLLVSSILVHVSTRILVQRREKVWDGDEQKEGEKPTPHAEWY